MTELNDLLTYATEFTFRPDFGALNDAITVAYRGPAEKGADPDRWAILGGAGWCWSKTERSWVYERRPSSRDEGFYAACRFSRDEAMALVPELLREIEERRIPELRRMVEARKERRR